MCPPIPELVVPAKAGTHTPCPIKRLRTYWVPGLPRFARSPGTTTINYFIACGLIGLPVPPVMMQRRAAEEEFVDAVLGAVLGQLLEIENLAHAQAHGRDHHPVPGLVGLGGFVRPHLDAPGIGADGGELLVLAPIAVLELDAGGVAAGITAPLLLGLAALHLAGAHEDEIAASDRHVLVLGAFVELVVGNALAVLHPFHAAEARDVEQHAAPDHLVLGILDAEHGKPARVDQLGVVTVIGLVLVEHVAERVPMGGALHAQHQRVVGVTDLVPVLLAGNRIGAGRQHLVDRIEAAAEQAVLRAFAVERNAEREHLAGADQARRLDDVLRGDVVERADLVVLAPAAPVRELLGGLGDRLFADLDIHGVRPFLSFLQAATVLEDRPTTSSFAHDLIRKPDSTFRDHARAILRRVAVFQQAGLCVALTGKAPVAHDCGTSRP